MLLRSKDDDAFRANWVKWYEYKSTSYKEYTIQTKYYDCIYTYSSRFVLRQNYDT